MNDHVFVSYMYIQAQREKGVIAASAGNHALALAYHGHMLGIPVTVVMPLTAPIMKVSRCEVYGATVVLHGNDLSEVRNETLLPYLHCS